MGIFFTLPLMVPATTPATAVDAETGEYAIDPTGVETALKLKQKNPNARLFTIRIGYDVAVSFGGAMERTAE
ncbi:hypothetical protein FACHB389_26400 [Nostoc calcicola FACHB-389]|nr:hypothetical protein [Nostoc calcicola FACHB-3891]OKH29583.1 hypothetical protein FACHB389_26400 [Nostoc calcicola FACHB-389]